MTTAIIRAQAPADESAMTAPIVHVQGDKVWADSREVARFFGKRHDNVLQSIRNLNCSPEFSLLNFQEFKINDLEQTTSHFMMTKDGFLFLGFGFSGDKAGRLKEAFLAKFNEMEEQIRQGFDIDDRKTLQRLLLKRLESEERLERLAIEQSQRADKAERRLIVIEPMADAYQRWLSSDRKYNLRIASGILHQKEREFSVWLHARGFTFRQGGRWQPHAEYKVPGRGYFDVKPVEVHEKEVWQMVILPRGIDHLAKLLGVRPDISLATSPQLELGLGPRLQ